MQGSRSYTSPNGKDGGIDGGKDGRKGSFQDAKEGNRFPVAAGGWIGGDVVDNSPREIVEIDTGSVVKLCRLYDRLAKQVEDELSAAAALSSSNSPLSSANTSEKQDRKQQQQNDGKKDGSWYPGKYLGIKPPARILDDKHTGGGGGMDDASGRNQETGREGTGEDSSGWWPGKYLGVPSSSSSSSSNAAPSPTPPTTPVKMGPASMKFKNMENDLAKLTMVRYDMIDIDELLL